MGFRHPVSKFAVSTLQHHHYVDTLQYGVATVSRIDYIVGLFCKRALLKRQYSAKETYNRIDPTNRSLPATLYNTLQHSITLYALGNEHYFFDF